MNKYNKIISIMLVLLLFLAGCTKQVEGPEIVVGSKEFTENIILGKMLIKLLEENNYKVVDETGLGATGLIRTALTSGQIDAYWEYTGTTLIHDMGEEASYDPEESYRKVKEWDESNNNIIWLDYSDVNNTYCIVTREDLASELNLDTISDMAEYMNNGNDIKFISNPEYFERPDGMQKVEEVYGFKLPENNRVLLDLGLFLEALLNNQGDVTVAFTTDALLAQEGIKVLEDDKSAFPIYNATPIFRSEIIEAYPELPGLVNQLSELLDNDTMLELNSAVDIEGKNIDTVAETFLKDNNLIK